MAGAVNPARPYRSYSDITMRETTAHQPLQRAAHGLPLERRAAIGTVTVNYTLSRNQTDSTNDRDAVDIPQNPANPGPDYADARTDRRHIFTASYVYELPFFRDSSNAVLKGVLGGWQISGHHLRSTPGQPVHAHLGRRPATASAAAASPTYSGQPIQAGETRPVGHAEHVVQPGGVPAAGRRHVRQLGPRTVPAAGFNKTDLTLSKNFYLPRKMRLQFRADFINAFNQVNWASDPSATSMDNTCTTSITSCTMLHRYLRPADRGARGARDPAGVEAVLVGMNGREKTEDRSQKPEARSQKHRTGRGARPPPGPFLRGAALLRYSGAGSRQFVTRDPLPTAYCLLPTAFCLLPTAYATRASYFSAMTCTVPSPNFLARPSIVRPPYLAAIASMAPWFGSVLSAPALHSSM